MCLHLGVWRRVPGGALRTALPATCLHPDVHRPATFLLHRHHPNDLQREYNVQCCFTLKSQAIHNAMHLFFIKKNYNLKLVNVTANSMRDQHCPLFLFLSPVIGERDNKAGLPQPRAKAQDSPLEA